MGASLFAQAEQQGGGAAARAMAGSRMGGAARAAEGMVHRHAAAALAVASVGLGSPCYVPGAVAEACGLLAAEGEEDDPTM